MRHLLDTSSLLAAADWLRPSHWVVLRVPGGDWDSFPTAIELEAHGLLTCADGRYQLTDAGRAVIAESEAVTP